MNEYLGISKTSIAKPDKLKNGAQFNHKFLGEENILFPVLGDGVASSPCDWKASKMGCKLFILEFKELSAEPNY